MKKCYIDSNILVYFKDDDSIGFKSCCDLIVKLTSEETILYISPLCLDEFMYQFGIALKKKFPKEQIYKNLRISLESILEIPLINIINPPTDFEAQEKIIELMEKYSLRPRDAYHLLTMQMNNIDSFATFDNDFKKVFAEKILQKA